MTTLDDHTAAAPAEACFRAAADVERWPEILPHYRWVRFRRKEGFANGLVEMAAYRRFGPLGWPTWWVSEMEHDAAARTITYRHVDGVTRGMDVEWRITPLEGGRSHLRIIHEWDGPGWPCIGRVAADAVIGPHFVSAIAGRTLEGVAAAAERGFPPAEQAPRNTWTTTR